MPLSDEQLKTQVILDVGDLDDVLVTEINDIWTKYDEYSQQERFLRARVDACIRLMAKARFLIQTSGDGRTLHLEDINTNLRNLLRIFLADLAGYVGYVVTANSLPEVSEMEADYPIPGNEGWPDPNDPSFYGSPVARQAALGLEGIVFP